MEEKKYTKGNLTVNWKPKLCTHSGICARGLASVFQPKEKPWIKMEGADNEKIIEQVKKCPSGALSLIIKND